MRYISSALFIWLCSASLAHGQALTTFLIDNFDNTTGTIGDGTLDTNGAWAGFGPGISGVLGGNRVLGNYLTQISGSAPFNNTTFVSSSGWFEIANPSNTRSGGEVIWQSNTVTPGTNPIIAHPASFANPFNLNFNTVVPTPNFYIEWSVINADSRDWTYTVRAYTNSSANYFEGTLTSNASGVVLSIAKNNFVVGAGAPNWADIDAISFSASYTGGLLGGDLAIDYIQVAVPEMTTWLMMGMTGLLCGSVYAYRRGSKGDVKLAEAIEQKQEEPAPAVAAAEMVVA